MQKACIVCGAISDNARCENHQVKAWAGDRRSKTTSGWAQQKRAKRILRQHHGICHVCGKPGADQADHVQALAEGGTDTDDNLRPIHAVPCHQTKTLEEAARARRNR